MKIKPQTHSLRTDVVVIGGGSSGLATAVAAARAGAQVHLVERYGFLGGTASGAMVSVFQTGPDVHGEPVIRGVYSEILDRLRAYGSGTHYFNGEIYKLVAYDMCEEAGVHLVLNSFLHSVKTDERRVQSVMISSKSGPIEIEAEAFVDASGDGDLCAWAGAEFQLGRELDGLQQPMTLMFTMSNVDFEKLRTIDKEACWAKFREVYPDAVTSRGRFIYIPRPQLGDILFCTIHVCGADGTDVTSLGEAERAARREAYRISEFFQNHVPGCEKAVLHTTAPMLGVRETRRICGDYTLTRDDILDGRVFDDAIACSTSWIDLHNPAGEGVLHEYLIPNTWFTIPYRSLCVKDFDNLLVAGRCLSATQEALASTRTTPTCIATGHAAGIAAALAAREYGGSVRQAPIERIQKLLIEQGAWLGPEFGQQFPAAG